MSRHLILGLGGGAVLAVLALALWHRKNPSACPYSQRLWIEIPHPFISRARLREILAPAPGERVLEAGPGTGYYTLETAQRLTPGGTLDVVDLQQEMLDHTMLRAGERGITNIVPTRGDATALPYSDGSFDAAFLIAVLGEIPDQDGALRELRRVLRPGGRLVVGELFIDPHMVTFASLRRRAEEAGLGFERRLGGWLGYFARFLHSGGKHLQAGTNVASRVALTSIHRAAEKGYSRKPQHLFYATSCMSIRPVLRAVTRTSTESVYLRNSEAPTQRARVTGG